MTHTLIAQQLTQMAIEHMQTIGQPMSHNFPRHGDVSAYQMSTPTQPLKPALGKQFSVDIKYWCSEQIQSVSIISLLAIFWKRAE